MWRVSLFALSVGLVLTGTVAECPNNCSGKGKCDELTAKCVCADSWRGEDCSKPDKSCAVLYKNCHGHGVCAAGRCVCDENFGGDDCSKIVTNCKNNCNGHGRCIGEVCECEEGYLGSDCGLVGTGIANQHDLCPANCSGHGICEDGKCMCFPGFHSGETCASALDLCATNLNNCTGHGVCGPPADDSDGGWECHCLDGFCGEKCDSLCHSCPLNCSGHGVCVGNVCECDVGFSGGGCAVVGAIAGCPNNCTGHGRCRKKQTDTSYGCVCDAGFAGLACNHVTNTSVCPDNCSGKGECFPDGCRCFAGFKGLSCNQASGTCESANYCTGNGECVDDACQCYPGFSGFDCTIACHPRAIGAIGCFREEGRGVCQNGTCVCHPGWEGIGCESEVKYDMWTEYVRGHNPIGSATLYGAFVVVGALGVGAIAGFLYKLTTPPAVAETIPVAAPASGNAPTGNEMIFTQ